MRTALRFLVILGLFAGLGAAVTANAERLLRHGNPQAQPTGQPTAPISPSTSRHLAGLRVALDPGHQLGNGAHLREIDRPVPAGGFTKPCNTVGTETTVGLPESTVAFTVAVAVKHRLEALGAEVVMTRNTNRADRWGPCVDARARFFGAQHADVALSIHADGAVATRLHGFHVIAPTSREPWTTAIAAPSLRLARDLRAGLDAAGLPRSTYVGEGTALSIRGDLATLNLSTVPVAMVELGNMRNLADARRMSTPAGRAEYADALVAGLRTFADRSKVHAF